MNEILLDIQGLNVFFQSRDDQQIAQALFDINFHLKRGQRLGIIGESGSGKTITLLSLLGLLDAQPGICTGSIKYTVNNKTINVLDTIEQAISINYNKEQLSKISKNHDYWKKVMDPAFKQIRGKVVSMVFQNPRLAFNPYISIGKQINETIRLNTNIKDKKDAKEKAIAWLAAVKLDAPDIRYNNNPYGLSGGMCQRAMLAMALASESDIIVADEPTSGLDATLQSEISSLLIELTCKYAKSMIIVSHDLLLIGKITDHVLVYYQGSIVESGHVDEVLNQAGKVNHPYTSSLVSANSSTIFKTKEQLANGQSNNRGCPYHSLCTEKIRFGDRCTKERPPSFNVSGSHQIACWIYQNG